MHALRSLLHPLLPLYHWLLPRIGACMYRFPAHSLTVTLVTGTKGKSSTVSLLASILRADGKRVAYTNSVFFGINDTVVRNTLRMSMPGRFFLQRFLRKAIKAGCTHVIIEATSEGALFFRHHLLSPSILVVTNLAPEHIEAHGSFENYLDCKLSLVDELTASPKLHKALIVNADDAYAEAFIDRKERNESGKSSNTTTLISYTRNDMHNLSTTDHGVSFVTEGTAVESKLPGLFSAYNCLAAITAARHLGVSEDACKKGISALTTIPGRAEAIRAQHPQRQTNAIGEPFDVIVDYAHTLESLEALYATYAHKHIIGVLGSMGGGRDTWKRPKLGALAEKYCMTTIITDEDPCDEDPQKIMHEIASGFTHKKPLLIESRRDAMTHAISLARLSSTPTAVLITGKGTDVSIKRANGHEEPWSDADVARDILNTVVQ